MDRFKLYRQIQENELYFLEPFNKMQAWIDLLITTSYKNGKIIVRGNIIEIKRGQNGYSEETLAKRRQWSRNKVRRFLNYLETIQQIEQQKSKIKSIITIINWEKYQGNDTTDDTTERHQTIQQTDTIKKVNKEKKEKKVKEIDNTIVLASPKNYGDPEINSLIEKIKEYNNGIVDGTIKEQRIYGKQLLTKLKQIESVKENKYTATGLLEIILKIISKNDYHSQKIAGPKKIYYELAGLMQVCKQELQKEKKNEVPFIPGI